MRTLATFAAAAPAIFVIAAACQPKQDAAPQPYPYATGQTPPGYPPATGYETPGYANGTPGQPPPAPPPPPPMPAGSGQMAVPGPIAFACHDDVPCGTHHCNLQYGKCAFPCQSAVDCLAPNACTMGLCVPAPAAPTTH
jgi:hypothetical protein